MPYGKVLVVDDVESNLLVAKGLLTPYGLNIETVNSGFEAIEKIKNDKNYDIVFMDHMMPKMDGLKTTNILRDMGYTRPIVALTANAVIGQEEMFLSNGFDGFISKPIDSRKLNHILIELIRNKKLPQKEALNETEFVPDIYIKPVGRDELAAAVVMDIINAIAALEDLLPKISASPSSAEGAASSVAASSVAASNVAASSVVASNVADLELFTTTVHGIKSALANIGNMPLSNAALRLEQAGNNGEITVISEETPGFISDLRLFMEEIKPAETDGSVEDVHEISREDIVFLRKKLIEIKTACEKFIPKDAKTALTALKQKTWTKKINDLLNEISVCLIRGEFTKVKTIADKAANEIFFLDEGNL